MVVLALGLAEADAEAELVADDDCVFVCVGDDVGDFVFVELGDTLLLTVIEGLIELDILVLAEAVEVRVGQLVGVADALAVPDAVPDAVRDGLGVSVAVTEADGVMDGLRSI